MKEEFLFYFGPESEFSHWFKCEFVIQGIRFRCAEQYIMFQKAMLFGDMEIKNRILRSANPSRHRYLGKRVNDFNKERWHRNCRQFAFDANSSKFSQNPPLLESLLRTAGKSLAEASPYDKIWGIGLSIQNPKIYDRAQWRGRNWAGEALEAVRAKLLK